MSKDKPAEETPVRRIDRVLATMSLGLLLLSIICFFAIIIATGMHADFTQGVWPLISLLVMIAPIIAFLLIMVVLIMAIVRRSRTKRSDNA